MIGNQKILIYLWSQREKFCVLLFVILDKTNFFELFLSPQSDDVGYWEYTLMLKMLFLFFRHTIVQGFIYSLACRGLSVRVLPKPPDLFSFCLENQRA